MARKKKVSEQMVSVFQPRIICGEAVEPFCVPTNGNTVSHMMAAATNLIWWGMHEALADGKEKDARLCSQMLLDIVGRELSDLHREEADALVNEIFERYKNG